MNEVSEIITTPYSGVTVPVWNIIWTALAMVIAIGVLVAAIILVYNHVREWTKALFFGLVAFLGGSVLLYSLAMQGLLMIPGILEYSSQHVYRFYAIAQAIKYVFEVASIFIGILLFSRSARKRGQGSGIGDAFSFSIGGYIAGILLMGIITSGVNYIQLVRAINSNGFDETVAEIVAINTDGVTDAAVINQAREEAIAQLLGVVNESPITGLLFPVGNLIFRSIVQATAAGIFYGVVETALEKKRVVWAFVIIAVSYVPSWLASMNYIPSWAEFVLTLVVALAAAAFMIWELKNEMPYELKSLSYSRAEEKKKAYQEEHKMPKITMPKD